jgi:phosphoadenosine phosphosulfate reductase
MPKWIESKLKKATEIIDKAYINYKRPYISCSWGKDSSVVMYLTLCKYPDTPVIFMNSGYANPDTYTFRDYYLKNIGIENYYEVKCPEDYIELNLQYGLPSIDRKQSDHEKVKKIIKKNVIDDFAKEKGFDCCIWGIRAEETQGRKILLKKYGLLYKLNDIAKCSPIGWWTANELWEFIDYYGIEYNYLYDKELPPFFTRATNKNSGWLTTDKATRGTVLWLKRFYPEYYVKLLKLFPEVKNYV